MNEQYQIIKSYAVEGIKRVVCVIVQVDNDLETVRSTLRMPLEVYLELYERVEPYIRYQDTQLRACITAEERLTIYLRYIAYGDTPQSLAQQFRCKACTIRNIIGFTSIAVCRALDDFIRTPHTRQEWLTVAEGFATRWNFPHLMGVLDGKHCRIQCQP